MAVKTASFTVTNVNASGVGSLRQAITDANSNAGLDDIDLSTFSNVVISDSLNIDGLTQPGATATTPLINIKNTNLTNFSSTVNSMAFNGLILENTTLRTVSTSVNVTNNRFVSTPSGSLDVANATSGSISNNTFTNGLGLSIANSSNLNGSSIEN